MNDVRIPGSLPKLAPLGLRVMEALWNHGPCSIRDREQWAPCQRGPDTSMMSKWGVSRREIDVRKHGPKGPLGRERPTHLHIITSSASA
jgi:hypothetical protein